jgi:hypothetical protein
MNINFTWNIKAIVLLGAESFRSSLWQRKITLNSRAVKSAIP